MRLLLAEDDHVTRKRLEVHLKKWGHEVVVCKDGAETWARLQEEDSPSMVVLDWMLPQMSGTEICRKLRDPGKPSYVYIIMLTAKDRKEDIVEGLEAGADDYIVKPFDPRELRLRVNAGRRIVELQSGMAAARAHQQMINEVLQQEIAERRLAQEALENAGAELERRVEERTAELKASNENLIREVERSTRAREAAHESEQRFRAIFDTARDCIFLKDGSLRYVLVNPAMEEVVGLPAADMVGRTEGEVFGAEVGDYIAEVDSRVLNGESVEQELGRLLKGQSATFLDIRAPMSDSSGKTVGICGICHDITDRARTREKPRTIHAEYPSPVMRSTLETARLAAKSDSLILLTGESGSGKDYLAAYIHKHSKRAHGPFFAINCAAVAPDLAESELFGHERGAFTGAHGRRRGLLELAEGGTLLLNEIGELRPDLQAKLLTFLDTMQFTRVGGRKTVSVRARIMAATNRDLDKEVSEGRFRSDLFYRLNVMSIRIPPLRERMPDLPVLVLEILSELAADLHLAHVPEVEAEITAKMAAYDWPGNVRELRNVLERALIVSRGRRIELPATFSEIDAEDWKLELRFPEDRSLTDVTRHMKRSLIEEALRRSRGNRSEASKLLGISRHALRRQMESLDVGV